MPCALCPFTHTRWLLIGVGLFLLACSLTIGPASIRDVYQSANELDDVLGTVELFMPAEKYVGYGDLSPDGRWMIVFGAQKPSPDDDFVSYLIDIEKGLEYNLDQPIIHGYWLDNEHILDFDRLFRISDFRSWRLSQAELETINELEDIPEIYDVRASSGWKILSVDPAFPYLYTGDWDIGDPTHRDRILLDIPHITVTEEEARFSINTSHGDKVYSPDGKYYVTTRQTKDPTHNLGGSAEVIYDAVTDVEVAHAFKWGWSDYFLGWASDSSGIYTLFLPREGDMWHTSFPIYKLLVPGAVLRGTPMPTTPPTPPIPGFELTPSPD